MPEKYEVKAPGGLAVSVQDPKLVHRVADALLVPIEALAGFTASAIGVLQIPLRLVQAKGERLIETVKAASNQVPPERQIEATSSIAGPILEGVKYLEPGNPLLDMYANLLARAMDRDRVGEAHPAFAKIIEQLSPDEARLLYLIRNDPIRRTLGTFSRAASELASGIGGEDFRQARGPVVTPQTRSDSTPRIVLLFPENADMYLDHLRSLNLIKAVAETPGAIAVPRDEARGVVKVWVNMETLTIELTDFGALFAKACIPDTWEWSPPEAPIK